MNDYEPKSFGELALVIGVGLLIIALCHAMTASQNPGKKLKATGYTSGGEVIYQWVDKDEKGK